MSGFDEPPFYADDDDDNRESQLLADEVNKILALRRVQSVSESRRKERNHSFDNTSPVPKRFTKDDHDLDVSHISDSDIREELFVAIPEPYGYSEDFQRLIITEAEDSTVDIDTIRARLNLKKCIELREKWQSQNPVPPQDVNNSFDILTEECKPSINATPYRRRQDPPYNIFSRPMIEKDTILKYSMVKGVVTVTKNNDFDYTSINMFPVLSFEEYARDFKFIHENVFDGATKSYSYRQLELLLARFNLHVLLNGSRELQSSKSVPHRDFYNVRKVDTHVHHSACMNLKHLLRFIKHKLRNFTDEIVIFRDGRNLTLGEVFMSLGLTAYDISIDTLDMHAHDTFHRFDRFNLKYNPCGQSRLREIFLKTDNSIQGRYLAEITKEVMADLQASKYQLAEWRISIYGRNKDEWTKLALWFYQHKLAHANIRWLIQVPRLFHIYRESGELQNFEEMLSNIFEPLFEVTLDPSVNPNLYYFLETIVGFDSVDDESKYDQYNIRPSLTAPNEWTEKTNPPYGMYMYYMWANICTLNKLRASRGLCTFQFRPHCGESGSLDHLVSAYLVADQINHGIRLKKNPSLQYLYYLSQIGIAMSPLSNNKLFLDYYKNPFPTFFSQGMNVSLSSDDPLMLHYTKDALLEEYSVATQVWKLSSVDQCEIARNSVLQSGWEMRYKKHYLGDDLRDIRETNVPHIRLIYRDETLHHERSVIFATKES